MLELMVVRRSSVVLKHSWWCQVVDYKVIVASSIINAQHSVNRIIVKFETTRSCFAFCDCKSDVVFKVN
jgi:hypothetical protein